MRGAAILMTLSLAACSVPEVDYEHAQVELTLEGSGPVAIEVQDTRAELEQASWVGVKRVTFGIPFDVYTHDGRPLADAVREALAVSLGQVGFQVVEPGEQAPRTLKLVLANWESDGYFESLTVLYSADFTVLDPSGQVLAREVLKGEGEASYQGDAAYAAGCRQILREFLGELFTPAVVSALQEQSQQPTTCSGCQAPLQPDWKVCPHCETRVPR